MENIETIKENEFLEFYNSRTYTANCFNDDGSLNKNYNSFKRTGVIATIFEEHWSDTYYKNKDIIDRFRPNALQEIQKIIDCYNKDLGCSLYECPTCHDIIFVGHTCKSRFCSSCGYKYKNDRVENILQTAYNCHHRQIVFTIPDVIRKYFFFPFENRINILFKAVRDTIYSILNDSFKKNKKGIVKKYSSTVTTVKHITPHKLRSTYGTNLYQASKDIYLVADVLGHKDVNTTRKHYAEIVDENKRSARNIVRLRTETDD